MGHARISKVRLKGGAAVLPIRKHVTVTDNRRKVMLETVGLSIEDYVRSHGHEPESIVFVLGGVTQPADVFWLMDGLSEHGEASMLALAAQTITRQLSR